MPKNTKCLLVNVTSFRPFRRCDYCDKSIFQCFGIEFFVILAAIISLLITIFFVSDLPALVLDIMIVITLLLALLSYIASKETEEIILNNIMLERLNKELKESEKRATRITADLRRVNEEQIKKVQMENEFIGIINHELKEPITAVLSGTEVIRAHGTERLNENQVKVLNIIEKSGKDMLNLTNNLLELSKIESGKIELYPEYFPLSALIEEVILSIKPESDKKNIRVTGRMDQPTATIYADPTKLKHVLFNLIDNSIKYTPENGSINIIASSEDGHVKIEVKDTGVGINKEKLGSIFDKFTEHTPGYEGTGLGLYISKSFVEAQNGHIEVESESGKGTIVRIFLPKTSKD